MATNTKTKNSISTGNILKTGKKATILNTFKRDYQLWIMILPALAVLVIFNYIPMYGIQLAFREFDFSKGLTGGDWKGLMYFKQFTDGYMFWTLIKNTVRISLTSILLGFPAPIFLALLFNQIKNATAKRALQTTVYLPHFISTVVMVGMMVVLLSPNTGIVGLLMKSIGLGNINLLGETSTFVPVYVGTDIWQHAGWGSIIYLAALASVDSQLYDACKIDGAGKWQTMWHVDIPVLIPTIIVLFVLSMGNVLNTGFEKIFLMQNGLNIPVSEVIATYVYKIGIISNQYSLSSAIGLFNTLINFFFLVSMNIISKKFADISLW